MDGQVLVESQIVENMIFSLVFYHFFHNPNRLRIKNLLKGSNWNLSKIKRSSDNQDNKDKHKIWELSNNTRRLRSFGCLENERNCKKESQLTHYNLQNIGHIYICDSMGRIYIDVSGATTTQIYGNRQLRRCLTSSGISLVNCSSTVPKTFKVANILFLLTVFRSNLKLRISKSQEQHGKQRKEKRDFQHYRIMSCKTNIYGYKLKESIYIKDGPWSQRNGLWVANKEMKRGGGGELFGI